MTATDRIVLGIESSCDETGVGLVRLAPDGRVELLADAVASSVDEHARFGGVVPEIASRAHLAAMQPTAQRALAEAGLGLSDVDAIAVTAGPGLAGALMVGVAAAKAYSAALGVPLYGVNHLAGHVAVDALEHGPLPERCLAMLVSGGHSQLLLVEGVGEDFWPTTYDRQVCDEIVAVSDADSFGMTRRLAHEEALLVGGSCGMAVAAALKVAETTGPDDVIVVLLPDGGRGYLPKV